MARTELIFYKLTTAVLSIALVFTLMRRTEYPKSQEGTEYRITRDETLAPDTTYITKPATTTFNTTTIWPTPTEPLSIHREVCNNDSSVDELLAFNLTCGKEVPEHVIRSVSKMYRELKTNGTIINDLIGTEHAVIPNIYHYVRFKQPELRFFEMLSIMSALKVGRADKVLIHTDEQLSGEYWDLVRKDNRVQLVHREAPTSIFGTAIGNLEHASDLTRIQVLREHGGIYLDNDCVVVNEIDRLRKHHCVVSKSSSERFIGNMILMGTKDCIFLRMTEELYKLDYRPSEWYYNGGHLPTCVLLDRYPGIVYPADEGVEQGMMHTLWKVNLSVEHIQQYYRIIHLYYRHVDHIDHNMENIKSDNTTFSRIARWILYDHQNPII